MHIPTDADKIIQRFSDVQKECLEESYAANKYPTAEGFAEIADKIGDTVDRVTVNY